MMDDQAIRTVVTRLARPHPSGGRVIERASILAEGSDSGEIIRWVVAHGGEPEMASASSAPRGLSVREAPAPGTGTPLRFVLPAGTLH